MPPLTSCYEIGLDEIGQEESDRQIIPAKGNSVCQALFLLPFLPDCLELSTQSGFFAEFTPNFQ